MAGRLAVDFGTSNTVVALWDRAAGAGLPLVVPDYAHLVAHGDRDVPVVPSVIHYAPGGRLLVGDQVRQHNLGAAPGTFRWMKRYISLRSPAQVLVNGRRISHFDAGRDFLSAVLAFAGAEAGIGDEEVGLTVPVESFEHYQNWLAEVVTAAGLARFRLIDEPSAAALGYGASIQPGNVYLLFDFGGGTLDVAVVLIEDDAGGGRPPCRVLGKAGAELGGATIDGWLFAEVLRRAGRSDADPAVRPLSRALLGECERAKERLSARDRAAVSVQDPQTGTMIVDITVTRHDLEDLLSEQEAYTQIHQTIRRAIDQARERGYGEDAITAVLAVGGSSLVPSVQRTLREIFGRDRVLLDHPIDAVARGAAAFVAGVDFYDHIQHDYAVRWRNPATGDYDYQMLVARGTSYPTTTPVGPFTVKATYDGQSALGIAIVELGESRGRSAGAVELVFDVSGAARLSPVSADDQETRTRFWMNEANPTFLTADPPARRGEERFAVQFGVDANKRLVLTARDLRSLRVTHRDYPVVKLT
jgi:molecular chaperone DnaK